ncbi:MAG: hypothetical protein D4R84_01320 [Rhodocyclaceae bacterium]|nr:MAG: hypothetical protein D4R84_01320 [Rhodocyclaceae bacterium]
MSIVPCFIYLLDALRDVYGYVSPRDAVLVLLILLCSVPIINILIVIAVWLIGADSNLDRKG